MVSCGKIRPLFRLPRYACYKKVFLIFFDHKEQRVFLITFLKFFCVAVTFLKNIVISIDRFFRGVGGKKKVGNSKGGDKFF